jgi:hypothetical protein
MREKSPSVGWISTREMKVVEWIDRVFVIDTSTKAGEVIFIYPNGSFGERTSLREREIGRVLR